MIWEKEPKGLINMQTYVAIDLETTGIDFIKDRIIEIGMIKWRPNEKKQVYHSLFKVDAPIKAYSFKVHGIRKEDLKEAPEFYEKAEEIIEFIGDGIIIGFNYQSLDFGMLNKELKLSGRKIILNPFIDIQNVVKKVFPGIPKNLSLLKLSEKLKVGTYTPHRALPDAEITLKIWLKIMEKLMNLGIERLEDFFDSRYYRIKIPEKVQKIFEIAREQGEVRIEYQSPYSGKTIRIIEPLAFRGKRIDAYCHLREDFRSFLLERILSVQ